MKIHLIPVLVLGGAMLAIAAASAGKPDRKNSIKRLANATFAGGCFWCMEHPYDALSGVVSVTSGYTGGQKKNPTYEEVSAGGTGHAEAVQIVYDPEKIGYDRLLEVFWRNIDPTTPDKQFCDVGTQYRSAIFFHDEEQRRLAEESKRALDESMRLPGPVVTEIVPASEFYRAEEYHQKYYRKNPVRYKLYRYGCGRDKRLQELWRKEIG
jgi:peptide-methionine (S)-S-oxide reductase